MGAIRTELRRGRQLASTVGASPRQRGRALFTELRARTILVLTPGTLHPTLIEPGRWRSERWGETRRSPAQWSTNASGGQVSDAKCSRSSSASSGVTHLWNTTPHGHATVSW